MEHLGTELAAKYQAFLGAVNGSDRIPEAVLSACKARIEWVHGVPGSSHDLPISESGHDEESIAAAVVVAEKMPFAHHEITDEEVAQVREKLGNDGCVNLLTALAFFDVSCRIALSTQTRGSG